MKGIPGGESIPWDRELRLLVLLDKEDWRAEVPEKKEGVRVFSHSCLVVVESILLMPFGMVQMVGVSKKQQETVAGNQILSFFSTKKGSRSVFLNSAYFF